MNDKVFAHPLLSLCPFVYSKHVEPQLLVGCTAKLAAVGLVQVQWGSHHRPVPTKQNSAADRCAPTSAAP